MEHLSNFSMLHLYKVSHIKVRQGKCISIAHFLPGWNPKFFTDYTGKSTRKKL